MNEVRKRTGELGSTQLSELRLGEFSIRSRRFYEIKLCLHFMIISPCTVSTKTKIMILVDNIFMTNVVFTNYGIL